MDIKYRYPQHGGTIFLEKAICIDAELSLKLILEIKWKRLKKENILKSTSNHIPSKPYIPLKETS